MEDATQLNALIGDIYTAALATDDPTPLLRRISEYLGFEACALVTTRNRNVGASCNASWGLDVATCERAERDFGSTLLFTRLNGREIQPGEFGFDGEFVSEAEMRKEPVYHEFLVPNRIQHGAKICLENSGDRLIFVNFGQPAVGDRRRQKQLLSMLAPHWARATRIFLKLGQIDVLQHAHSDAANLAPFAIVILDDTGALYLANRKAEQSLRSDGLALLHNGLHAARDGEQQRLQQAIRAAIASSKSAAGAVQGADLCISRPSGRRSYQVVVTPLPPATQQWGQRRPAAAVVIFDPDEEMGASIERCRDVFGFTRAEAQIALGIMQGRSLEQIASAQGNAVATARNLLKRVYVKTGVNRQSELARVMLHSPLLLPTQGSSHAEMQH
ncbi:MAG: helix-turn-helix transcriptional regulator [Pseudomonadales bacterium]|nr:helix-turn-helix transcriptional regulator [Pseudomonadales bacterium]